MSNIKVYIKNVDGVKLPQKSTDNAAGYDIFANSKPLFVGLDKYNKKVKTEDLYTWRKLDYIQYGTSLFIDPSDNLEDYHIDIRPRSSISKENLLLANPPGTVDVDYRGEVMIRFKYYFQPSDLIISDFYDDLMVLGKVDYKDIYHRGDKIAQILPCETIGINFEFKNVLSDTIRNDGGFGSTGK